jgi:YD repeat-containing protein
LDEADATWRCTAYDARGRVTSASDSAGKGSAFDYSVPAQVTNTYTDSAGAVRTTTSLVDALGRSLSYTDELGTISRSVTDQSGRVTDTYRTFAGGSETLLAHLGYDPYGRPSTTTEYASGTGRTTTTAYDPQGRPQTTTRPNGVYTTTGFDSNSGEVATLSNKNAGGTEGSAPRSVDSSVARLRSRGKMSCHAQAVPFGVPS